MGQDAHELSHSRPSVKSTRSETVQVSRRELNLFGLGQSPALPWKEVLPRDRLIGSFRSGPSRWPCSVELRHLRWGERCRRLEQRAQPLAGRGDPAEGRGGDIHCRHAYAADDVALAIGGNAPDFGSPGQTATVTGGGVPAVTHLANAVDAASTTGSWGPSLISYSSPSAGVAAQMSSPRGRSRPPPAADASGVRLLCRHLPEFVTSVSVSNMNTGTVRSAGIRRSAGPPLLEPALDAPLKGAPVPPRLWINIPSNVWVSGWRASAKVVR